jgi:hypothetical protein
MDKLTLKELDKITKNRHTLFNKYFYKFINKKYNFNFIISNVNKKYIKLKNIDISLYFSKHILPSIQIYYMIKHRIVRYHTFVSAYYDLYNNDIEPHSKPNLDKIKETCNCTTAQIKAIEFFSELENIKEFCEYLCNISALLYKTPYIYSLPLAYTFLLCNKSTNTFPKDITKLIGHKILFFKIEIVEKEFDKKEFDKKEFDKKEFDKKEFDKKEFDKKEFDKKEFDKKEFDKKINVKNGKC